MRSPTVNGDLDGAAFAVQVGARLRALRKARMWSLQDVVNRQAGWSASAIGAWERGSRAISVPLLYEVAAFYGVSVSLLLGGDRELKPKPKQRRLVFDLEALQSTPDAAMVERFVRTIIVERGDYNGRVLTIRDDDMNAICTLVGVETHAEAIAQLDNWGVLA